MSMPENNLTTQDQGGREKLGSRMGFIMLSAGCAIGCGNVWKFPWMCGQNGGGSFILVYLLCLILLGLPAMVMEFSVGRSAQTSPLYMYKKLQKPGQKWGTFRMDLPVGKYFPDGILYGCYRVDYLLFCQVPFRAERISGLLRNDYPS